MSWWSSSGRRANARICFTNPPATVVTLFVTPSWQITKYFLMQFYGLKRTNVTENVWSVFGSLLVRWILHYQKNLVLQHYINSAPLCVSSIRHLRVRIRLSSLNSMTFHDLFHFSMTLGLFVTWAIFQNYPCNFCNIRRSPNCVQFKLPEERLRKRFNAQ